MGCIGSRLSILRSWSHSSRHLRRQNIFQVLNVDDTGRQISPGKLEVTETNLVLHVRGKPALTWPLRCLRRYGYDDDLFSFESGRRCPTGAGIYAFKCHRAQSLFNLLQARIQGNSSTLPFIPSAPISPTNVTSPSSVTSSGNPTFDYVNIASDPTVTTASSSGSGRGLPSSSLGVTEPVESNPSGSQHDPNRGLGTTTTSLTSTIAPIMNSMGVKSTVPNGGALLSVTGDNNHHVYMNVESSYSSHISKIPVFPHYRNISFNRLETAAQQSNCSSASRQKNYSSSNNDNEESTDFNCNPRTLSHQNDPNVTYTNVVCNPNSSNPSSKNCGLAKTDFAEVNYAELDLKTDNQSSSRFLENQQSSFVRDSSKKQFRDLDPQFRNGSIGAPSSIFFSSGASKGELGYATIDFDRTAALSVVTRSKIKLDFSSSNDQQSSSSTRKNRHNSTTS